MRKKYKIKVGDNVTITAGNHKGSTGRVISISRDNDRAKIEGVNIIKKHVKPSAQNPQGGITEAEGTIHVSNLMLTDSKGEAVRVGYKIDDKGNKVRIAKKTGEEIK